MKRRMTAIGMLILVIGAMWMIDRMIPRSIDMTLTGVKVRLGTDGVKAGTEPAVVILQGKLYTSLSGKRTFKGEATVAGEQIPVPRDQRKLTIHFAKEGWGAMSYPYLVNGGQGAPVRTEIYQSHLIFANEDFTQVSLLLANRMTDSNGNYKQTVWDPENGMAISAPAATRDEALAISDTLMREYLESLR
ncbi:hypothetical protein ACFFSY_23810 [Paenibacillus aurantiacus]|uniref:Uncharacterized protein n=1 Tax=Paenibacillus aurantiacus TaxID=1936118 RepID=A0ABV5KY30_9BACL